MSGTNRMFFMIMVTVVVWPVAAAFDAGTPTARPLDAGSSATPSVMARMSTPAAATREPLCLAVEGMRADDRTMASAPLGAFRDASTARTASGRKLMSTTKTSIDITTRTKLEAGSR